MTSNAHVTTFGMSRAYPGRSPHKLPRVGKLPVHPTFPVNVRKVNISTLRGAEGWVK